MQLNEAATRALLIDPQLKAAEWPLSDRSLHCVGSNWVGPQRDRCRSANMCFRITEVAEVQLT